MVEYVLTLIKDIAFVFCVISFLLGNTKFWQRYITSHYKISKQYNYDKNSSVFFEKIIKTCYYVGFSIQPDDIEKNTYNIIARAPYTLASFGEKIHIRIEKIASGIEISFHSICSVPFQIYDWKKNKKNAEMFFKKLGQELEKENT